MEARRRDRCRVPRANTLTNCRRSTPGSRTLSSTSSKSTPSLQLPPQHRRRRHDPDGHGAASWGDRFGGAAHVQPAAHIVVLAVMRSERTKLRTVHIHCAGVGAHIALWARGGSQRNPPRVPHRTGSRGSPPEPALSTFVVRGGRRQGPSTPCGRVIFILGTSQVLDVRGLEHSFAGYPPLVDSTAGRHPTSKDPSAHQGPVPLRRSTLGGCARLTHGSDVTVPCTAP